VKLGRIKPRKNQFGKSSAKPTQGRAGIGEKPHKKEVARAENVG
jgi:hypothetical protein